MAKTEASNLYATERSASVEEARQDLLAGAEWYSCSPLFFRKTRGSIN
jgi:hypothetical protein